MSKTVQLRIIQDPPPAHGITADPVRQVFEHWVAMFAFNAARTKLDDERRAIINGLLVMYDLETVLLGVEGMASVPMGGKPEGMVDTMCELAWFGRTAARFERAIRHGERLRLLLAAEAAATREQPRTLVAVPTPEEAHAAAESAQQARAKLVSRMAELRARHAQ